MISNISSCISRQRKIFLQPIYFYEIFAAPTTDSGNSYFECLLSAFQEDGSDTYLQNHLYGFASKGTGSATLMDRVNGTIAFIWNELATNKVYAVHFMPHKLHKTLNNAFRTNYNFQEFELHPWRVHILQFAGTRAKSAFKKN